MAVRGTRVVSPVSREFALLDCARVAGAGGLGSSGRDRPEGRVEGAHAAVFLGSGLAMSETLGKERWRRAQAKRRRPRVGAAFGA